MEPPVHDALMAWFHQATAPINSPSDAKQHAVVQWCRELHRAFYNHSNAAFCASQGHKFIQLEAALVHLFTQLAATATHRTSSPAQLKICESSDFWRFAVDLLLCFALQMEKEATGTVANAAAATCARQLSPAQRQPQAPLAFLSLGALKQLVASNPTQKQLCETQGRVNAKLTDFCQLHMACISSSSSVLDERFFAELVELFHVTTPFDFDAVHAKLWFLLATRQHSALIKLLETFRDVFDWQFHLLLHEIAKNKDWSSAELFTKTFDEDAAGQPRGLAIALVQEAINLQELKRAHKLLHLFSVQIHFPDLDMLYKRDTLVKLCEKQRWQIACSFVGADKTLQLQLVQAIAASGERRKAEEFAQRFQLEDVQLIEQESETLSSRVQARDKSRVKSSSCLPLLLPSESIVFCDSDALVQKAWDHFTGIYDRKDASLDMKLVGLDVEWKPTTSKAAVAIASILQIASRSQVFILDLLELHQSSRMFKFLEWLFRCPEMVKVGFSFEADLKVLNQTFPERQELQYVERFVDASDLLVLSFGATSAKSLSHATTQVLGKALDKSMQLSNWEDRPLSDPQLRYAALDALCLVQLVEKLTDMSQTKFTPVASQHLMQAAHKLEVSKSTIMEIHANERDLKAKRAQRARQLCFQRLQHQQTGGHSDAHQVTLAAWHAQFNELHAAYEDIEMVKRIAFQNRVLASNELATKCICFFAKDSPCVAIVPHDQRIDIVAVAKLSGVPRRKIKFATHAECRRVFGFDPGCIPPFGHAVEVATFIDSSVANVEFIYGGSPEPEQFVRLRATTLVKITNGIVGTVCVQCNDLTHPDEVCLDKLRLETSRPTSTNDQYKFLADSMLGRVARWLRMLGIDVVVFQSMENDDGKANLLAQAAREQRILLTRDKKLADRRDCGACFVVSSDDVHLQFHEVRQHFAIELKEEDMMSRCPRCNSKGFAALTHEQVRDRNEVADKVIRAVDEFYECKVCHQIFWEGPKYDSAFAKMLKLFE